jgi:cysteinyl-tRNA synthetase
LSQKEKTSAEDSQFSATVQELRSRFEEAMDDDFNTALAIGHMYELIREINRYLDTVPSGDRTIKLLSESIEVLKAVGKVLNVFQRSPLDWHLSLLKMKRIPLSEEDIDKRIIERQEARKVKDWQRADAIRNELKKNGIILEDTLQRTLWRVNVGELRGSSES